MLPTCVRQAVNSRKRDHISLLGSSLLTVSIYGHMKWSHVFIFGTQDALLGSSLLAT